MTIKKEQIESLRGVLGFPEGNDEDILKISKPPYYMACPNLFINQFLDKYGKTYVEATDKYHREPFAADVSEGKNDAIYNAHSYHTKVPYKAIMKYILHYTNPGDIVFDGFSGSGMTGVATQMCGNPDSLTKMTFEHDQKGIKWGTRKAILNDLSPIATFISSVHSLPNDAVNVEEEITEILDACEKECSWMYETKHNLANQKSNVQFQLLEEDFGKINYIVWSDILICPNCSNEIIFYNVAVNMDSGDVEDIFNCSHCNVQLKKTNCKKATTSIFDDSLNRQISILKQTPVLINYSYGNKRFDKQPDDYDIQVIERVEKLKIPYWYPIDRMCEGKESRRNDKIGITHVHHFYYKRSLYILSKFYSLCSSNASKYIFTACNTMGTKMSRYGERTGNVSGTLYIPSLIKELNIIEYFKRKLYGAKGIISPLETISKFSSTATIVNTASLEDVRNIRENSIDYIFTDPPFGSNLNYSELSYIWESWLKVKTTNSSEAIINSSQNKGLLEYQQLMTNCFKEYFRVLKPNRWITVEFHNSQNSVWNAIRESIHVSGLVIADVRILDKKQGSFKQVNNEMAVKQDLVISAYKPKDSFKKEFLSHAGSIETAWDFTRLHLEKLPVVVLKRDKIELVAERQAFLLFDRMIAFHIINGISIPIDAADYYKGLDDKFLKRDEMYFLHDQINEYDSARISSEIENVQTALFINDEKTAIAWLYNQLTSPQAYAEIQPKFMQEIRSIEKHEKLPELSILLEDNFVQDEMGRWYMPNITKSGDIMKLREKRLLKEFDEYLVSTGKLKVFRTEAVRVGFAKLWKEKKYRIIVETAERLPESVIQEDEKLLMYYDISLGRLE